MSGVTAATAATVAAYASAAAVAYSVYSGERAAGAQSKAQAQAKAAALKQETAAEQATNRANQKRPDTMAILDAAAQSGKGGLSGTMLTGAQGIDQNALMLGKNTLLGG